MLSNGPTPEKAESHRTQSADLTTSSQLGGWIEGMATGAGTRSDVAHLLRRAAFGASAEEIDTLAASGYEAAVDKVCDHAPADLVADALPPPTFDTAGYLEAGRSDDAEVRRDARQRSRSERLGLATWWLQRMVVGERPWREKLTLLWHDHFATSVAKVRLSELMSRQRATLYGLGAGRFDVLTRAVARDQAMLVWLDGGRNRVGTPNENFARELLELFTLGHGTSGHGMGGHGMGGHGMRGHGQHDHEDDGAQPYTEQDVAEAARACTGWRPRPIQPTSGFDPRRHDDGSKTVLGVVGRLEMDDVVDIAAAHPACAPHVVSRLVSRLGWPAAPSDPVVVELAAGFAADLDVTALLRRLFLHPAFLDPATRSALVRTPVEFVVGALRALGVPFAQRHLVTLRDLGQVPLLPPDVSGWPSNEAWLSTSAALQRLRFAEQLAQQADLAAIADAVPGERADAVARLLGIDRWSAASAAAFAEADGDPHLMVTLALVSPEFLVA